MILDCHTLGNSALRMTVEPGSCVKAYGKRGKSALARRHTTPFLFAGRGQKRQAMVHGLRGPTQKSPARRSYRRVRVDCLVRRLVILRSEAEMGHDITAYADERLTQKVAYLRLLPSEAFVDGNIYDVLRCQKFRRSCSGDGGVAKFLLLMNHEYPCEPNNDSQRFLDAASYSDSGNVWVTFE